MTTERQHKRRRPGDGGVYRRPNGTYAAVLDLGTDSNGKRRRRFVYAKTEPEALDRLRKLQRQLADTGDLPTADMRVDKWLTYWLDNIAAPRIKPSTLVSYRGAVRNYLIPSLGKRPLSRLAPHHVREMHAYVKAQGCNSSTVRNAHRILGKAINDAVREGRVARNIVSLVPAPLKASNKRGALTFAEACAILAKAASDERTASRWLAAFLLGARQGEYLGLRWAHVDLDNGLVDLAWSLQRVAYAHGCGLEPTCGKIARACPDRRLPIPDGYEYEQLDGNLCLLRPKTKGSRRVVGLPDMLLAALRLRHEQSVTEANPHGLVWTRPNGRPIHPKDDWTAWVDLRSVLSPDRRNVTLHEARHSVVTWLAEAGVPENVIMGITGHSDVLVNRSYQHVTPEVGRRALNLLGAQLALPAPAADA